MVSVKSESWSPDILDKGFIIKNGKKIYFRKAEPHSDKFKRAIEGMSKEIRNRMDRLSPLQKKCVEAYYFSLESITQIEVAQKLGISRSAVREHLDRAIKKLGGKI